jgi:hypothetical protein
MRPDQLERRLRERLNALGPAPRAKLLHVLTVPRLRAGRPSVLDGAGSNAPPPDLQLERVLRRRDRKRRNQRIAAGVVGIAVFVAAVWFVTTGGSFNRTETPAAPGGIPETAT